MHPSDNHPLDGVWPVAVLVATAAWAIFAGQFCRLYASVLYCVWRSAIPPRHSFSSEWMIAIVMLCVCHCAL